jgi:hypothetical protein
MRMRIAAMLAMCSIVVGGWAAGPEAGTDSSLPTFRITAAEIHISLIAVQAKNQPVTDLTARDIEIMRDGRAVNDVVSFERRAGGPLSTLVMVDVSDSMMPALPLERAASQWLEARAEATRDRLWFVDFGDEVESGKEPPQSRTHLTSLYDVMMQTMPKFASDSWGRRSLILLTDGIDNYSLHSLNDVIALAQRLDIAVYAITAHPGKKQFYRADVLTKLCEETGGRFFEVRKADTMLSAMAKINDELRNGYEVAFRPGPAAAGMHQVRIRARQRPLKFFHRAAYFQPAVTEEVATR